MSFGAHDVLMGDASLYFKVKHSSVFPAGGGSDGARTALLRPRGQALLLGDLGTSIYLAKSWRL